MAKKQPAYLQTFSRGLQVLEFLAEHKTTTVTVLSKKLNIQKSASYRFLNTLKLHGYLSQDQHNNYILTDRITKLGNGIIPKLEFHNIVVEILNSIVNSNSTISNLAKWNGEEILYLAQSNNSTYMQFTEGKTVPAYCSALGKAILALQSDSVINSYIQKTHFEQYTATTTTKQTMWSEIEKTRNNHYGLMCDELCLGLKGLAIPIIIENEPVKYAISVTDTIYGDPTNFIKTNLPLLEKAREELLGYLELNLFEI